MDSVSISREEADGGAYTKGHLRRYTIEKYAKLGSPVKFGFLSAANGNTQLTPNIIPTQNLAPPSNAIIPIDSCGDRSKRFKDFLMTFTDGSPTFDSAMAFAPLCDQFKTDLTRRRYGVIRIADVSAFLDRFYFQCFRC